MPRASFRCNFILGTFPTYDQCSLANGCFSCNLQHSSCRNGLSSPSVKPNSILTQQKKTFCLYVITILMAQLKRFGLRRGSSRFRKGVEKANATSTSCRTFTSSQLDSVKRCHASLNAFCVEEEKRTSCSRSQASL